jgi:protein tyrosine/serine phosphatase
MGETGSAVRSNRCLDWPGCYNVRDLGGLHTADGHLTRWGAVVRSEAPHLLTAEGWTAVQRHNIRTIVDLRNDDEIKPDLAPRPADLHVLRAPLDASQAVEFWNRWATGGQIATPLYYRPFLDCFRQRIASALGAIAHARPGGVLVHCAQGRDRTGLVTLVLLALLGVPAEDIAADYVLSARRLAPLFARLGQQDPGPGTGTLLTSMGTSAREIIIDTVTSLQPAAYLRSAGLCEADLATLRARLLEPSDMTQDTAE